MPFWWRKGTRQPRTLPILTDAINEGAEAIERKTVTGGAVRSKRIGDVVYLYVGSRTAGTGIGMFRTTSTVSGRTSSNPGSCNGQIATYDPVTNTLSASGSTFVFKNISAYAWTSGTGKYGWFLEIRGVKFILALEC